RLNLPLRSGLIATCALVIGPATRGLDAAQLVPTRRAAAEACHQVTTALIDLVPDPFEPVGYLRQPSRPEDRRRIEAERTEAKAEVEEFRPIMVAFLENMKALAAGSRDADAGIRIQVRHVIEELAVVRRRLIRLEEGTPKLDGPRAGEPL